MNTIDNANLLQMCHDCGAVGFVPAVIYTFDAAAKTVTVEDNSTIPAGDTAKKTKIKVHDMFGGTVVAEAIAGGAPAVVNVADLNLSKQLALAVTVITNGGIIADGGAYGLMASGDVAHWDIQRTAAV